MKSLAPAWRTLQGHGLYLYGRALSLSGRFHVEGWRHVQDAGKTGRPLLWALWHGQLMPFVSFGARFLDPSRFVAIRVGDERGDTLGVFSRQLGGSTVRVDMSGNPFAAGRAVLRVIQAMESGSQSVIAPDGPDGPPFVPKPGVAFLARKARAAILPVGAWTRHAFHLRRWDRYLLPVPFARTHVVIGAPLLVDRQDDQQLLLNQIAETLHRVRYRAQVLSGVRPWPQVIPAPYP